MNLSNNTILITGGATGIGFELARQFIKRGNTVIVCGRRMDKLSEAKRLLPQLITQQCDLADIEQRRSLFQFCITKYPELNVLIHNAGIQKEIDFRKGEEHYIDGSNEIAINMEAVFHLTALFTPHLMQHPNAAIINVSSGLGLVPLVIVPVYSATKAAMHSFSISLRKQLKNTSVNVYELMPPIVDTDLDKGARDHRGQKNKGITAEIVAEKAIKGLQQDKPEIAIGIIKLLRYGARISPALFLNIINK
jgi:uncharacterized oxidoreductase